MNGIVLSIDIITQLVNILADAFITRKTVEFCKDVKEMNETILYFINTSPMVRRKAIQIKEKNMEDLILNDLTNNKHVYCCFSSKKSLTELEKSFMTLRKRNDNFKNKNEQF